MRKKEITLDMSTFDFEAIKGRFGEIEKYLDDGDFKIISEDGSEEQLPIFVTLVKNRNKGLNSFLKALDSKLLRVFAEWDSKGDGPPRDAIYNDKPYRIYVDLLSTTIYLKAYELGEKTIHFELDDLIQAEKELRAILNVENLLRCGALDLFEFEANDWSSKSASKIQISKPLFMAIKGFKTKDFYNLGLTKEETAMALRFFDKLDKKKKK